MAKIGVVTLCQTYDNYGQVLQYLATQEFLHKRGHRAYLLVFRSNLSLYQRVIRRLKRLIIKKQAIDYVDKKKIIFDNWQSVSERHEHEHPRLFSEFRNRYFNIKKGSYNNILSSGFDAFCVGSDQMWGSVTEEKFLGWVPSGIKKIAIAPSVGAGEYNEEQIKNAALYLKSFNFITVREYKGVEFCKVCGRKDAVEVLDPVFLHTQEFYNKISEEEYSEKPYVFIYMLGADIEMKITEIIQVVTEKGLDYKYVESQGRDENIESIPATIEKWLGLIRNSKYVVTNSYHGMAFAIIFRKPFVVFPITGILKGMNSRIINLASKMQLSDRIFNRNINVLFNPINWTVVDTVIKRNKKQIDLLMKKVEL